MSPFVRRSPYPGMLAALLAGMAISASATPARMLVFVDPAAASPWASQFLVTLRAAVHRRHPEVVLDVETFPGDAPRTGAPPAWMAQKYARQHYDIVLTALPDIALDVARLRDQLWPQAAMVTMVANARQQDALQSVPRRVGLLSHDSMAETLALVFQLLPQTTHVAVITRTLDQDPLRPDWGPTLAALRGRATLIDLSGKPIEQLQEQVRRLPRHAVIVFGAPGTAGAQRVTPRDEIEALARNTHVPVFVDAATLLGTGVVGGAVVSPEALAQDAAGQVLALLDHTPPEHIGLQRQSPLQRVFDWHALQRWHIPLERLPPGSTVLDQPPALWDAYRSQVLIGIAVLALQSVLIAALLLERRRRHRAELQARAHLAHQARLNRGATLGTLSAALAHEINQPLGAILCNAETAELLLDQPGEIPHQALRELLTAIREDDLRAAEVLQRLRAWMADRPPLLRATALNPLLQQVAQWMSAELQLRETELQLQLAPVLPLVQADEVQVQQVVLNLVLNAMDAVQAQPPSRRRIVIRSAHRGAQGIEVSVIDSGPGLGALSPERLFEPFFTTKPGGLGVGLAICRGIVELHGGGLEGHNQPGGGACFRITLPLAPAPASSPRAT